MLIGEFLRFIVGILIFQAEQVNDSIVAVVGSLSNEVRLRCKVSEQLAVEFGLNVLLAVSLICLILLYKARASIHLTKASTRIRCGIVSGRYAAVFCLILLSVHAGIIGGKRSLQYQMAGDILNFARQLCNTTQWGM